MNIDQAKAVAISRNFNPLRYSPQYASTVDKAACICRPCETRKRPASGSITKPTAGMISAMAEEGIRLILRGRI